MATVVAPTLPPSPATARVAGLRYVGPGEPGIARRRAGRGFAYVRSGGRRVRDKATLARIRRLAIPPAWTDVWICADERGHVQATGRDARGRKQYRYHPKWRRVRDEAKYERTMAFAEALPAIRARVRRDLARKGLPRGKVLAAVVRLLEATLARVGNEEYAQDNGSYGLTTLRDRHADVRGSRLRFRFRGKGGKVHDVALDDPVLARVVRRSRDLPGQELFQYEDEDGEYQAVASTDVNAYLRDATGQDFTAKDFRTWAGTVIAALALREAKAARTDAARKRRVVRAIERVAERLGNTPAVCRKCYVHPEIVASYLDGTMEKTLRGVVKRAKGLDADEAAVLGLLRRRLSRSRAPRKRTRPRPSRGARTRSRRSRPPARARRRPAPRAGPRRSARA